MGEDIRSIEGQILVRGDLRLDWDELGEGLHGDWDPDDSNDVELLRFTLYRLDEGEWAPVDDASYCTQVPVSTDMGTRQQLLEGLLEAIENEDGEGSIKKRCEELSWVNPTWYAPCEYTNCHMYATTTVGTKRLCREHGTGFSEFLARGGSRD